VVNFAIAFYFFALQRLDPEAIAYVKSKTVKWYLFARSCGLRSEIINTYCMTVHSLHLASQPFSFAQVGSGSNSVESERIGSCQALDKLLQIVLGVWHIDGARYKCKCVRNLSRLSRWLLQFLHLSVLGISTTGSKQK
jgi:hypothetical protein